MKSWSWAVPLRTSISFGPEVSEYTVRISGIESGATASANIAVGGRTAGRPDDTTVFPQTMYVDWVRVYQDAAAAPDAEKL